MSQSCRATMIQLICILLGLFYLAQCQQQNVTLPIRLPTTVLSNSVTCPLLNNGNQRELVRTTLQSYYPCSCGGAGGWTRAVYLNMSDPNQQCPSNWNLTITPIRGCGRRAINNGVCDSETYSVYGRTYSYVCGRILAFQRGHSGAFFRVVNSHSTTIETPYLSGVSLTHGPPGSRQHIWSFAGASEEEDTRADLTCPCTNTAVSWPYTIPSFINNDYFCDTGNRGPGYNRTTYYTDDPLWDGKGCGYTSTCCEFNAPPWFCKSLPHPTNDDLEIRNCYATTSSYADKIITLIDIFVK